MEGQKRVSSLNASTRENLLSYPQISRRSFLAGLSAILLTPKIILANPSQENSTNEEKIPPFKWANKYMPLPVIFAHGY